MERRKKLIIGNLLVVLIGLLAIGAGMMFIESGGDLSQGEKTILVCAIDESEPRPGMGACDMAFVIKMNNGELVDYMPIYPSGMRHPTVPEPPEAQAQGAGDMLLLHEAFWYDDNEQSLQNAKEIVEYNENIPIDVVIAINSEALDKIITAASPLTVNGKEIDGAGIDFIRDGQDEDGLSRGDAVMEVANALGESANDPNKRMSMVNVALDQYAKGNIIMSPQGAFNELIVSKGFNSLFS